MTELELAILACREAGDILMRFHTAAHILVREKNPRDIVTEADVASENHIISLIAKHYPAHGILAEESGHQTSDSEYLWVIDPLDGTSNFFKGQRDFCVLVSLVKHDEILFGVTYFPFSDELFVGERSRGATKNGSPIQVSSEAVIGKMYAVTQMTSHAENRKLNLRVYEKLIWKTRNIHVFNACIARGLTDVAEGIADFEFREGFNYWDFAAGTILVEEAGGIATDFSGAPITRRTTNTVISNGKNHRGILELVQTP